MGLSNTRFVHLIAIVLLSLMVAIVCYLFLGGFVAEIKGAPGWAPGAIQVGGSLAGFLIIFFALLYGYGKLGVNTFIVKVALIAQPPLKRSNQVHEIEYCVIKQLSGAKSTKSGDLFWEAAGPAVHLRDIEEDDLVIVRVKSADGTTWETNHFCPMNPSIDLLGVAP